jgi:hypothetical protein
MPCEDEGRDWSGDFTSQGAPKTARNFPEEKHRPDSSSQPSEGTNPANSILAFWPPEL